MSPNGPSQARPAPPAPSGAAALAARIARGDPEAFAAFYEAWFDRTYAAARRLTGRDESFALDVVQEVMLRVARKMRPLPSDREVERWMARVTHTTALDLLRREARRARRERAAAPPADRRPSPAAAPSDEAAAIEEQIALVRARLTDLPGDDAALVGLRFGWGRTLEQAGEATQLSGDAAHGRLRRAIARLRAVLRSRDDGGTP